MNRVFTFIACFCMLGATVPGEDLRALPRRLDQALYHQHAQRLVVAGRIGSIQKYTAGHRSDARFDFKVEGVLLGYETYKGKTLSLDTAGFVWPEALVRFSEDTFCIFVLGPRQENKKDYYVIYSVLPAQPAVFFPVATGDQAMRRIIDVLLAELQRETDANRQRHLILQVSPILTRKEADALVPFLKDKDPWLRRAALAGLVYATKQEKYIKMAEADIQRFINTASAPAAVGDHREGRCGETPIPSG